MGDETEVLYTDDFEVLGLVGQGAYGKVYLIQHRKTKDQFARKDVDISDLSGSNLEKTMDEVKLMEKIDHPNIVSLISYIEESDYLYIFTEFCGGGNLKEFISSVTNPRIPEDLIVCWLVQLTEALQHLHERRILHRDIKPENIFLSERGDIKLGDLGISRQLKAYESVATTFAGTPCYMSPEIMSGSGYNDKTDIWSLGCVIYELATTERAYQVNNYAFLIFQIVSGRTPTIPPDYSTGLVELNYKMMLKDPDRRPDAKTILKSEFIQEFIYRRVKPMTYLTTLKTPSIVNERVKHQEKIRHVSKVDGPFRVPIGSLTLRNLKEHEKQELLAGGRLAHKKRTQHSVSGAETILDRPTVKERKKSKTSKDVPDFSSVSSADDVLLSAMSSLTIRDSQGSSTKDAEQRHELIVNNIHQIQKILANGVGDRTLSRAYELIERAKSVKDLEANLKKLLGEKYPIYQPYIMYLRIFEALLEALPK